MGSICQRKTQGTRQILTMGLFAGLTKTGSNTIGQRAEDLALQFLKKNGMQLIDRNYRCKMGEIDLVMLHDNELVFVEVRYRKQTRFGSGAESVDYRKQQKILKSAEHFLQRNTRYRDIPCRIDVVSITAPTSLSNRTFDIDWISNAVHA